MDIMQAIKERHSVRAYLDKPIEKEKRDELDIFVRECNEESGLYINIVYDDPEGFDSKMAHYGSFRGVSNFIILAGDKNDDIDEKCGYYGEKIVIKAQMLGLNTCWTAMTFNKGYVTKLLGKDKKLCMAIALGYGENPGKAHKSKSVEDVVATKGNMPEWFKNGVEAALLAPTAVNQQKFKIGVKDGEPIIKISGLGFCLKTDLGIVKYHFEVGSGKKVK